LNLDKIKNGDFAAEELIDTEAKKKQCTLGEYDGHSVIIKKGKFGLYVTWGDNSKPLKGLGNRPIENITFNEVKPYLEEGSNFIREISSTLSIRKGKTDYLYYKTSKMKKPSFYDLSKFFKETKEDYRTCNINVLKEWIKKTYEVF
jgi:topoisomerase IA-like protein